MVIEVNFKGFYMQIQNISAYNTQNVPKTSFGAIHPTKYYVKLDDGAYHEVRSQKLIKTLQRKIITWLNKDYNSAQKNQKSTKETPQSKALRERIVRFFNNRDTDYRKRPYTRSFYHTNSLGYVDTYILTGKSAEIVENAAKPIEDVNRSIKNRADAIADFAGLDYTTAKKFATNDSEWERMIAARMYHDKARMAIRNILSRYSPENSRFDAFFVPQTKGNKISYELVDAKFDGK